MSIVRFSMSQSAKAKTRRQAGMVEIRDELKELVDASIVTALVPIKTELGNLPDKQFLDDLINKISTNLTNKFDAKFQLQEERTKAFEDRLAIHESNMAVLQHLEERVDQKLKKIDELEERVDNGEQYSRRLCLRMYNIDLAPPGTKEDCMKKVKTVLGELDCGVEIDAVDRAHRIGPREKVDGKERQQMIVKFKSFNERTAVYRARKKAAVIRTRIDLTRRRLGILKEAKTVAEEHKDKIEYVFADINCSLAAKLKNDSFIFFNSIETLEDELGKL